MTSHELARQLLAAPDLSVAIPGTGPAEGEFVMVEGVSVRRVWNEPDYPRRFTPRKEEQDSEQKTIVVIEA